ncbi:hypothetical protein BGX38DRAFT_1192633, partial [Terfezia claveryi]
MAKKYTAVDDSTKEAGAEPSGIPWPTIEKSILRTTTPIQPFSDNPASRLLSTSSVECADGQAGGGPGLSIALQRYLVEPPRDGGPTYSLLWDAT